MKYDVVIIGGGPGGLRCAEILAGGGARTMVLERNVEIGRKVCAGGITWGGLITSIPESLIQRTFRKQTITTRFQKTIISEKQPMVATVSRLDLGAHMAQTAREKGAELLCGALVKSLDDNQVHFILSGRTLSVSYDFLVGADGSNSRVRSYLGIDAKSPRHGVGMHYIVGDGGDQMVWNFNEELFGSGYSWKFPHRECASVGADCADHGRSPLQMKTRLDDWLNQEGIDRTKSKFTAEKINIDYRGWAFQRRFLVGDAAGLASPLTGEGINPAFVSGEAAARTILDPGYRPENLNRLIRKHQNHRFMLAAAGSAPLVSMILSEICVFFLRLRVISFEKFEMA